MIWSPLLPGNLRCSSESTASGEPPAGGVLSSVAGRRSILQYGNAFRNFSMPSLLALVESSVNDRRLANPLRCSRPASPISVCERSSSVSRVRFFR